MHRCLLALILAVGALPAAETYVIAVGVEKYDDTEISPLQFAARDASAVAAAFVEAGVPAEHITVLTSDDADPLRRPTRSNVIAALSRARNQATGDDTLIFLFSGHGMQKGDEPYLLTVDSRRDLLADTALPVRLINDALRGLRAKNVLFIIDACRNDPDSGKAAADAQLEEKFAKEVRPRLRPAAGFERPKVVLLMACDVGERAWEMPDEGHGAFTYFLLRGLAGEARSPDGGVRVSSLGSYMRREVPAWAERAQRRQTPRLDNPDNADFLLVDPAMLPVEIAPVVRNQPPKLVIEEPAALAQGEELVLGPDEERAEIRGHVIDDDDGVKLLYGEQELPLRPDGENRWKFVIRVPIGLGAVGTVTLKLVDAAGEEVQTECRFRRPRPGDPEPPAPTTAEPPAATAAELFPQPGGTPAPGPTPGETRPNVRPAAWPAYLAGFQPPAGMTWASFKVSEKDGMPQVLIPAGEFAMGSSPQQMDAALALARQFYRGAQRDLFEPEGPQRRIYVSAFWMDLHEVAVAQFKKFCQATGRPLPTQEDFSADNHPVLHVTWDDARAYAAWVGRSLPTEAEWEKAARGGLESQVFPWGNAWDPALARCDDRTTTPVGSYPPNGYGLLDVSGNATEWCLDWFDETWYRTMPDRDPCNTTPSEFRVLRGGHWMAAPYFLRVAHRMPTPPDNHNFWSVSVAPSRPRAGPHDRSPEPRYPARARPAH